MSFFDSVKKSLGMSKDKQSTNTSGAGHSTYDQFEFTFIEEKLGIGISKYTGIMPHLDDPTSTKDERSCPVVTNFDAHKYDVQTGDLIVALEGNPISSFDDFTTIIKAIGRPVRIKFLRRNHRGVSHGGTGSVSAASVDKSINASNSSGLGGMNIFRNLSVGTTSAASNKSTSASAVVLSEEEKALRRERLSAAAHDRSKSWDKKLSQKKPTQTQPTTIVEANVEPERNTHADTEKAIRKTKELEVRIEQQMGYSPFRPHMSFSSGAGAGAGASGTNGVPSSSGSSGVVPLSTVPECGDGEEGEPEEGTVAEVDDAFAMLLSLGESEQELGRVAVLTVSRMIQNLAAAPGDQKLRSIRVSNKAFQSKVASVPGGAELLVAAGYDYHTCTPTTTPAGAATSEEEELFLVHSMEASSRKKLLYTLNRVQELLESVGGSPSPVENNSPRPK